MTKFNSLLLTAGLVGLLGSSAFSDDLADNQARIGRFSGDVQLLTAGAAAWINPHEGAPLESGDEIQTGEDGTIDLVLSEDTYWRIEPNTDVITEHMESHGGRVSLVSGSVLGTIDLSRVSQTPRWSLNTPAGNADHRGGEFGLSFTKEQGLHLGIFQNEVEWQSADTGSDDAPVLRLAAGKEIVLQRGKAMKTLAGWSPEMRKRQMELAPLRRDRSKAYQTWTPWTETTRVEIRKKFIPPAPHHITHAKPARVPHGQKTLYAL